MNKILNVPIVTQKADYDCSVSSLSMLLKFYGNNVPYEKLIESLKGKINSDQRHIEAVAIYLTENGYKVHFANFNKSVLSEVLINKTEKDLADFEKYYQSLSEQNSFKKTKLRLMVDYINMGGKIDTHQPNLQKLTDLIERGIPVVICVKAAILRNHPDIKSNHYVIISGVEDNDFILSDSSKKFTYPYKIDSSTIFNAWRSTGYYTVWIEN